MLLATPFARRSLLLFCLWRPATSCFQAPRGTPVRLFAMRTIQQRSACKQHAAACNHPEHEKPAELVCSQSTCTRPFVMLRCRTQRARSRVRRSKSSSSSYSETTAKAPTPWCKLQQGPRATTLQPGVPRGAWKQLVAGRQTKRRSRKKEQRASGKWRCQRHLTSRTSNGQSLRRFRSPKNPT